MNLFFLWASFNIGWSLVSYVRGNLSETDFDVAAATAIILTASHLMGL